MDSAALNNEMQALLAHSNWVQGLARRLVRDPNVAEDLAQETMLAAIRDGGNTHRSAKAWLGTVLRNLVWERVRREDRRGARELDAAREEAIPSTGDLMDRMSAHKELVEVLMTLPETYREVLLRRYFEGESPNEIASSLNIPHSTVRTRLSRATSMMRERLDEQHGGDGETWVAALLPLTSAPLRTPELATAASTVTALQLPAVLVGSLLLVSLVALGWLVLHDAEPVAPTLPSSGTVATPSDPLNKLEPALLEQKGRTPSKPTPTVSESSTAAARATQAPDAKLLRGRVVDTAGVAQAGVFMRFERYTGKSKAGTPSDGLGDPLSISDADGAFSLRGAPSRGWVVAERDDLVTIIAGTPTVGGARDSLVVVTAPSLQFAGRLLDESGQPVSGASLVIRFPKDFTTGFKFGLEASAPVPFETTTGEDGSFIFDRAPGVDHTVLAVGSTGFEPLLFDLPTFSDLSLELELVRTGLGGQALVGEVVDPSGNPIALAKVTDGRVQTLTDDLGQFRLAHGDELPRQLMAMSDGFQPGRATAEQAPSGEQVEWPEFIALTLGPPPLEMRGQLVDGDGRGLRGVRVWVADPTLFWAPREHEEGNTSTRVGVVPLGERKFPELVEGALAGTDPDRESPWPFVYTDADGRFVLKGLLDREYALEFLDVQTLMRMSSEPFQAGRTDITVRWLPDPVRTRVAGRVVSTRGDALRGLSVGLICKAFSIVDGEEQLYSEQLLSGSAKTDSEGRFVLRNVPLGTAVFVQGPNLPMAVMKVIDSQVDEEELVLEVTALARLTVELADPNLGDSFSLKDDAGERLALTAVEVPRRIEYREAQLTAGRSGIFYAPLEATQLVLYRAGEVVRTLGAPAAPEARFDQPNRPLVARGRADPERRDRPDFLQQCLRSSFRQAGYQGIPLQSRCLEGNPPRNTSNEHSLHTRPSRILRNLISGGHVDGGVGLEGQAVRLGVLLDGDQWGGSQVDLLEERGRHGLVPAHVHEFGFGSRVCGRPQPRGIGLRPRDSQ